MRPVSIPWHLLVPTGRATSSSPSSPAPSPSTAPLSSGERVAFRQINRQTGHRLKQQLVDEHTGDPVEAADKARGYEVGKGDYMLVEDDELEAVAIESQHTIDIDRFVPRAQIDERYLDAPYYLVPNDKVGQDAFRRDPGRHARQGHGRARPRGHGEARTRHHAPALGQGADGHHACAMPTRFAMPPATSTNCRTSPCPRTC